MAEPIGLASGLLTLTTFAFQSSITLYNTIHGFQSHPQRVRDLEEELKTLNGVLHSLSDTVSATPDVDLSPLNLPLLRCGKACEEFEQELLKCSSRSNGSRTSFRDWAKLTYMGENIDGFRQRLAGYTATINIALTDANLRQSSVTAESLETYRNQIKSATDDLEAHLQSVDEKLETILARTTLDPDPTELQHIREERLSTQQCLQICAQLSDHLNQIQLRPIERSENSSIDPEISPERITSEGIQECKISLHHTTEKLERHSRELLDQLMARSKAAMTQDEIADFTRLHEEWKSTRQCIDICSKANYHSRENITVIDNHASGDEAIQFLVSTSQKTIHGKNRGHGFRIRQVGGHLNDDSLQQLSRDISRISENPTMQDDPPSDPNVVVAKGPNSDFHERYGRGMRLTPKSAPDTMTSKGSEDEPSNLQRRSSGGSRSH